MNNMNKKKAAKLLEINLDSFTKEELDHAYRTKCKEKHPDKHPNDPKATDNFRQIIEAYDFLDNILKKKEEESQMDWVVVATEKMAGPEFTPLFNLFGEVGTTLQQMAEVFSTIAKNKKKEK